MNYDFTQKNHWRNRIWNLLAERVTVHPRDAVVLYLAAETDFDRPTARRKGFRDENLIAVDKDPRVVARLREGGALAICGDIIDVLIAWPENRPIHAVIADFCCGLEPAIFHTLPQCFFAPHLLGSCVAINLLRGRDGRTNGVRECLAEMTLRSADCGHLAKHRGFAAFTGYLVTGRRIHFYFGGKQSPIPYLWKRGEVAVGNYRSSAGQYFDWCVFNTPSELELVGVGFRGGEMRSQIIDERAGLRRSISAVLAHRTRRLAA